MPVIQPLDTVQKLSLIPAVGTVSNVIFIALKVLGRKSLGAIDNYSIGVLVVKALPVIGSLYTLLEIFLKAIFPPQYSDSYTKDGMPVMDKKAAACLYKMHKEFDEVCEEFGVHYAACSGTALGALRQNPPGIIPWDDDIDLVLPIGEEGKLSADFEARLAEKGLKLRPHWGGYKVSLLECPEGFGMTYAEGSSLGEFYWPFLDLFVTYKNPEDGRLYINCQSVPKKDDEAPSTKWPKESWAQEDLEELTKVAFGPQSIPLAKHVKEYLVTAYGKDCMTTGMQGFDHKNARPFVVPQKITITDFSPATFDQAVYNAGLPKAK